MWNAVFRYLHQLTYEEFVIWMNTPVAEVKIKKTKNEKRKQVFV